MCWLLHAIGLHEVPSLQGLGPLALSALIVSSAVRWVLTSDDRLPETWLDALNVIDVGLVVSLIWSYQFVLGNPASVVIKAPAFAILLLIVSVRVLRFHPRPIVVTGIAAVVGWVVLLAAAARSESASVTTTADLTSLHILPIAEFVRLFALAGLVIVLARGTYSARRVLGRAAHVSDYGEALEAAQIHLEQSVHARDRAESALAALDMRDAELSEQNRLFNAALAKMSQGLCMFDQDQKLLVCNDRYIEMYGLSQDLSRPGTPFRKIVESRIANGLYFGDERRGVPR